MGFRAKKFAKLFAIYLVFTVEVQIHASSDQHGHQVHEKAQNQKFHKAKKASDQWVSEPQDCQVGSRDCAIMAKQNKTIVLWDNQEVVLTKNAALAWSTDQTVRLVRGVMSIQLNGKNQVALPNGKIAGTGLVLVERQNLDVNVTTLSGEITVSPVGGPQVMILPSGFKVSMGAIERTGQAGIEIPQVAPPASTIRLWWSVFSGAKDDFMVQAKNFVKAAPEKAELAGDWQLQMIQREVAEANQKAEQIAKAKEIEAKEQAQMRALFRKLNYLGTELPE